MTPKRTRKDLIKFLESRNDDCLDFELYDSSFYINEERLADKLIESGWCKVDDDSLTRLV